jgi:hypothetical protein
MKNDNLKFKILTFLTVILIFTFYILHSVSAQSSSQFFVSWQAQSYIPNWYQGKVLPTSGTPTEISFELIDKGKLADLSKTKVRWYVNDELVKNEENGLGIKILKTNIPNYAGQETEIRISVVDYLGGEALDRIIKIPVVGPEVTINAPYPDKKISAGSSIFQAIPFFFNIKNLNSLSVEWSANEQKPAGLSANPWLLNLNIGADTPTGAEIKLSVLVRNFLKELEFATKSVNLTIK